MTRIRLAAAFAVVALVLVGTVGAAGPPLNGSVGPGFTISLKDGSGAQVTRLGAGAFTLTVDDRSEAHNFRLRGPGVNVATSIEAIGTETFDLTLVNGIYTFVCDPHPSQMRGSFTVGEVTAPPAAKPPVRLNLTVTAKAVTLTTPVGKPVKGLASGPAVITVRDRSAVRGVRLVGAGVGRSTPVKFVGTVTWNVTLSAGTLVYASDARKPVLKGGRVPVS